MAGFYPSPNSELKVYVQPEGGGWVNLTGRVVNVDVTHQRDRVDYWRSTDRVDVGGPITTTTKLTLIGDGVTFTDTEPNFTIEETAVPYDPFTDTCESIVESLARNRTAEELAEALKRRRKIERADAKRKRAAKKNAKAAAELARRKECVELAVAAGHYNIVEEAERIYVHLYGKAG